MEEMFRNVIKFGFFGFVLLFVVLAIAMLFMKNTQKDLREFDTYYRMTLDDEYRHLPVSSFSIGPKTISTKYDDAESEFVYVGVTGDYSLAFTEVFFADGGRYLGYYQRSSFNKTYADGFVPKGEMTEITKEEFLEHVPE